MSREETAKQFSFRLPEGLVNRVEDCAEGLRASGLDVTRTDVVRMLLKHALDATHCDLDLLLGRRTKKARPRKRVT
jgi:hypothetical protein